MANLNLNKVVLAGRLTNDTELKNTSGGVSCITFTIAVNRRYIPKNADGSNGQPQADFINCVAWRQTAEFINRYFHKGSSICITGSIQTRNWTDTQNVKHYATEVIVDEAMFVDSKGENTNGGGYNAPSYSSQPATTGETPTFTVQNADEDLPF